MIAASRMGAQGWTAEQAMKEMHFFGYTTVHLLMCPGLPVTRRVFQSVWRKVETNPEQMPRIRTAWSQPMKYICISWRRQLLVSWAAAQVTQT